MEFALEVKGLRKTYKEFTRNYICLFDYLFISS